ncbi:unnamed protein product, partial [Scytosiphon promiscuus]
MWGSLSLGSIRDAATKLKDGLEAQMDEAMQQSGPIVVRTGPGAAGEGDAPSSPGAVAGFGGGSGGEGTAGSLLSPGSTSFVPAGGPPFPSAARANGLRSFDEVGGGGEFGSSDGRAWNGGEVRESPPPSPPPRASRLGLSPPQQQETASPGTTGQASNGKAKGKAETARRRRERLKRERAERKKQAAAGVDAGEGGGDSKLAALGKDKPRVMRLPTSPDLPPTPTKATHGAGDGVRDTTSSPPPMSLGQEYEKADSAGRGEGTDDGTGDVASSAAAALITDNGSTGGDAEQGGAAVIGVEGEGGAVGKFSALSPGVVGLDEAAADGIGAAAGGGGWGDASLGDSDDDDDDDAGAPQDAPQSATGQPLEEDPLRADDSVREGDGSPLEGGALPTAPGATPVAAGKGGGGDGLGEDDGSPSPVSAGMESAVDAASADYSAPGDDPRESAE